MSATVIKVGDGYNRADHMEFQITAEADLSSLPECAIGSIAYLDDLSNIWMRNSDKQWVKI